MTREQAQAIAEAVREEKEVPREARLATAEQQYIELSEGGPEKPSPVRDVRVWLVRFAVERGRWVELAIDDTRGDVVRVRRSR
ncbi:MAG: hypothetical protein JXB05_24380 [Myxococcaceae bacterium]|nr:hypothetical protein [Myxococcaceae bacterium]